MEKQTQYHHQQQQQVLQQQTLKCPRCDSSNTKFCYYNNYSLSQPRHFCKACKRYWTRGGTLRNVPVGGGCRKNKKIKKHSISTIDSPSSSLPTTTTTTTTVTTNPNSNPPLFYGVPTNHSYYNFNNFKATNVDEVSGYDLHTQMKVVHELGFAINNSVLSSYPVFGSSSTSTSMASLVSSSLEQQQKYVSANSFLKQVPREHDMKADNTQNKMDLFNIVPNSLQNQIQQIGSSSDSSLLWMLDPTNLGSSVPLI